MNFIYILSLILLIISFLLLKKSNNKLSIICSIIYSICLLFFYQVVIFYFLGFFNSLIYYSIINLIISIIVLFIIFKKKKIQKYYFNKKELVLFLVVILSSFLVTWIRFRGFSVIIYTSDDSSIHYRSSLIFSKYLTLFSRNDYKDLIYNFSNIMPANYINGGLFLKLVNNIPSYKAYMIYDSICYILYSLLFLVIVLKLFNKKEYLYYYVITMLYMLSFPLNCLVFGFGYLGLGVMCIQLLCYTIISMNNNYDNGIILKIILLFMLSFSLFFSYYLFVPPIYLSLFIYYIWLYKNKKLDYKNMLLYIFITLIIPFIIGFMYFVFPTLFKSDSVLKAIGNWGVIYDNLTPIFLFNFLCFYLALKGSKYKKRINYFLICFYFFTVYIIIFLFLYIFKISELYYFYKLFYIYCFFVVIYLFYYVVKKKGFVYFIFSGVVFSMIFVYLFPDNGVSVLLGRISIFPFNSIESTSGWIRYDTYELEIVDKALEYKNICQYNNSIFVIGENGKKAWFYSIVGSVPNINYKKNDHKQIYDSSASFYNWLLLDDNRCVVYFYKNGVLVYDNDKYNTLFLNDKGVILMKK